jgi:HAD superfamily hydrolase (TIGR01509 family)
MKLTVAPHVKGLIFDLDGTLADTMPTHYRSWQMVAAEQGIVFPESLFYAWSGVPTRTIAMRLNEQFGYSLDPLATEQAKERYYLQLAGQVQPIAPVVEVLKAYHGKMPVACGTGNLREIALLTLEAIGLQNYFQILVTFEDVQRPKPAPDTFLRCAGLMGVDPALCQVFEDGEPGLEAARMAGMVDTDIRPFLSR